MRERCRYVVVQLELEIMHQNLQPHCKTQCQLLLVLTLGIADFVSIPGRKQATKRLQNWILACDTVELFLIVVMSYFFCFVVGYAQSTYSRKSSNL